MDHIDRSTKEFLLIYLPSKEERTELVIIVEMQLFICPPTCLSYTLLLLYLFEHGLDNESPSVFGGSHILSPTTCLVHKQWLTKK